MQYLIVDEQRGNVDVIGNESERHDISSLFRFAVKNNKVSGKYLILSDTELDDLKRSSPYFSRKDNIEDFVRVNVDRLKSIFGEFREHSGQVCQLSEIDVLFFASGQIAGCNISTNDGSKLSNFILAKHAHKMGFPEEVRYILLTEEETERFTKPGDVDHEEIIKFCYSDIPRSIPVIPAALAEGIGEIMDDIKQDKKSFVLASLITSVLGLEDLDFLRGLLNGDNQD